MTFGEIYAEIILRAGEGYDAYLDRAKEMFWKVVASMIQAGDWNQEEIRDLENITRKQVRKSEFNSNKYGLWRVFNAVKMAETPLHESEIFHYNATLEPVIPDNCRFTKVSPQELANKNPVNYLNILTGLTEVIYALDYPFLLLSSDTQDFRGDIMFTYYGLPRTYIDDDTTDSDRFFSYGFLVRAMEKSAELLKTETE